MQQNYVTNFTKELDKFYYLKVKTVNGIPKVILYHNNDTKTHVGVVFCLAFNTLKDAMEFATKFDLCNGHL